MLLVFFIFITLIGARAIEDNIITQKIYFYVNHFYKKN